MHIYEMYMGAKKMQGFEQKLDSMVKCFDKMVEDMKYTHPEIYCDIMDKIYVAINGYHFNKEKLDDCYKTMINDDGSKAPKWTVEETNSVARNNGISFKNFNEYDWNYVMNMIYSDYCEVLGDNVTSYVKMANKFLHDKDAPDGKAMIYAMCMKKERQY